MNDKLLFFNGRIHTMQTPEDVYAAMLVENGRITALFHDKPQLQALEIDLHGDAVYPGFTDCHTHSFEGGLYSLGIDLGHVTTLADVLDLLRQSHEIGGMIFAFNFDENHIKEKRFPSLREIDQIQPQYPMIIRRVDGHSCVVNSEGLRRIMMTHPTLNHEDGLLRRQGNDFAAHWFHHNLTEDAILQSYHQASDSALNGGFTAIHTMVGDADQSITHYELLTKHLDDFDVRFIPYPQSFNLDAALKLGATRIGGCILADGSFGSHTAALHQPYTDEPGNRGHLYQTDEFWVNFIRKAHANRLQVGVHCIGDRAVDQILHAYETVQQEDPQDLRHELIHCELITDSALQRIKNNNVSCVMQPMFDALWGGTRQFYARVLGDQRAMLTNRFQSIVNHGILLCGSSDWYITELKVLKGLEAAMHHHNHQEALNWFEALRIYTVNAARLIREEHAYGMLLPGFVADFTTMNTAIADDTDFDKVHITGVFRSGRKLR